MSKLIMANLKMNLTKEEIREYKSIIENSDVKNLIICPSYIYLSDMVSDKYDIGAQNGYHVDKGAYTGEISFYQLNNYGIKYSLIGHSERRHVFNETDSEIVLKMQSCINNNITPILCVGETKEERESGKTKDVIDRQITTALEGLKLSSIIVAYEPVWAIGTGLIPTMEDINDIHLHIKDMLSKTYNLESKVLYGGSVNLSNIKEITNINSVDGVLIGSASNNPNNLINMYNEIK